MKRFLPMKWAARAVLLLLLLGGMGMNRLYALHSYDFSQVINGTTYYFKIISNDAPRTVELTYPGVYDGVHATDLSMIWKDEYGNAIAKPTGNLNSLPTQVTVTLNGHNFTYTVIGVGDYAFYECTGLTNSLNVSDTYTYIGNYAFYGVGYAASFLTLSSNLVTIGQHAFDGCAFQTALAIPSTVTTIGAYAFRGTWFQTLSIPSSVTSIGAYAFADMTRLETLYYDGRIGSNTAVEHIFDNVGSVYAPNGCTLTVGNDVLCIPPFFFAGCTYLHFNSNSTTLPAVLDYAFYNCTGLTGTVIFEGAGVGDGAFQNCTGLTGVSFDNSNRVIGDNAFKGCTGLNGTLTVPCNSVGDNAFYGCTGLSGLTIGSGVSSIGLSAFNNCTGLTRIDYEAANCSNNDNSISPFFNSGAACHLQIADGVETIPEYMFNGCIGITTLYFGTGVESVGNYAFDNCTGITQLTYNAANCGNGNSAFGGASARTWSPFYNCGNSRVSSELVIGSSVRSIPDYMFANLSNFSRLTFQEGVQTIGNYAFGPDYGNMIIGDYSASGSNFACAITIPASVTALGHHAFYKCTRIYNLAFANGISLQNIPRYCFADCDALTGNLIIPNSVTFIGESAFNDSYDYHPDGQGDITNGHLTLSSNLTTIDSYAFKKCVFGGNLVIPNSVTQIYSGAFSYFGHEDCNDGNTTLTLSNQLQELSNQVFYSCQGFATLDFNNTTNLFAIGDEAFAYSSGFVGDLAIPNSVTSIGDEAFHDCSGFNGYLTLPANLTYMGTSAFESCSSLQGEADFAKLKQIPASAFKNCTQLQQLYFNPMVNYIGDEAFSGCRGLQDIYAAPMVPPTLGSSAFNDYTSSKTEAIYVHVPDCNVETSYEDAGAWGAYFTSNQIIADAALPCTYVFITDGNWSVDANWLNSSKPAGASSDANIIINANCTLDWSPTVSGMVINDGYSFVISDGRVLTLDATGADADNAFNNQIISGDSYYNSRWDWDDSQGRLVQYTEGQGLIIMEGGQLKHDVAGVKAVMLKEVPFSQQGLEGQTAPIWVSLSWPMMETIDASSVSNALMQDGNQANLYLFDQAYQLEWRSMGKYSDPEGPKLGNLDVLEPGRGYLYSSGTYASTWVEDPQSSEWVEQSYQIPNETLAFSGELRSSATDFDYDLEYTTLVENVQNSIVDPQDQEYMCGYNFVGNPFACNAYLNTAYFVITTENGVQGIQVEPVIPTSREHIAPLTAVFVTAANAGQNITFSRTYTARSLGMLNLAVEKRAMRGTTRVDKAIVSFREGDALPKLVLNPNKSKLYIPQNGKDYAIAVAEPMGVLPVNFEAFEDGNYTLSVTPEEAEFSYLHLIDNLTGADIDLLMQPAYTFEASTMDYASRFKLVFSKNEASEDFATEEPFAFYDGSEWVLATDGNATVQLVDMMGRVIRSTEGAHTISTNGMATGVYVLRLVNGDNVRTQKIVVR